MAFMTWEEKYQLDIKVIDDQHHRLFNLIEDFYDALRDKEVKQGMSDILQGLTDYSVYHFHSEEAMMALHGYPEHQRHRSAHEQFIATIGEFRERFEKGQLLLPLEVAEFLKQWLSHHILVVDKKFGTFFHEQKNVSS